jgi:uridylate kinase
VKRILLKLSGEQLSGKHESGIDAELMGWIANEVQKVLEEGVQVAIMVGGGNFVRGAQLAGHGIQRVTADHIGMLGTMMNGLAITDVFEDKGIPTRCLSNIFADQVAEKFVHRLANKHFEKDRVVIIAGGIGRPYLTTDTAAVSLALELSCDMVLKATKVDGVYDSDPTDNPSAIKLDAVSYDDAVANPNIKVMDKAAMGLAMEHAMPVVIFDLMQANNLKKIVSGEQVGTKIG